MKILKGLLLSLFLFLALGTFNLTFADNSLPTSYRKQVVDTPRGKFTVHIGGADLNSTRVVVDTASNSDCGNNCPVLPFTEYVKRSGAFGGVSAMYFCPATYPACASKKNSFDTLLMNKNKFYFNSANNVYSNVPAAIFSQGSARFVTRSLEWGRDTSPDAVIANYPLLVFNGNQYFNGDGDPKHNSKGPRQFIANKGNMVYIGSIANASMLDAATVLKSLGVDNALNLDNGASSAFFWGDLKVRPGRNVPAAILLQRR